MAVTPGRPPAELIYSLGVLARRIEDPGNAGVIPNNQSGYVEIVTTGAQTRTLAAPLFMGQELHLCFKTDGGDCVITVATTVLNDGTNTITLNDAGDSVILRCKVSGANLRWTIAENDGSSLSTV